MNNRILELANQCFINENKLTSNQIESFYNRAHQDGQKQMRERAALLAERFIQLPERSTAPEWRDKAMCASTGAAIAASLRSIANE